MSWVFYRIITLRTLDGLNRLEIISGLSIRPLYYYFVITLNYSALGHLFLIMLLPYIAMVMLRMG